MFLATWSGRSKVAHPPEYTITSLRGLTWPRFLADNAEHTKSSTHISVHIPTTNIWKLERIFICLVSLVNKQITRYTQHLRFQSDAFSPTQQRHWIRLSQKNQEIHQCSLYIEVSHLVHFPTIAELQNRCGIKIRTQR